MKPQRRCTGHYSHLPDTTLVTGATGFLGRHLIQAVKETASASIFVPWDRSNHGNFLDSRQRQTTLLQVKPKTVIHLAWEPTGRSNYEHSPQNADWARATAEFALECGDADAWLLCAGSAKDVHNDSVETSNYSLAKQELRAQFLALGDQVTWFSPQYVFSLADARPRLIKQLLEDSEPENFAASHPARRLDFIHVDDVAQAIITMLQNQIRGQVYVGSGELRTVEDLVSASVRQINPSANSKPLSTPLVSDHQPRELQAAGWKAMSTATFFVNH